ncbi:MAG TPA: hypothetical protein VIZ18_07135 [Ktedonobacteraceae bacterium]
MFEAVLTLSATAKLDDKGRMHFQVYEDRNARQDFLSPLASVYYQDVYRILQGGDTLTVTLQIGEVKQTITTNFREGPQDYVFEEAGFAPCPDLFPRIEEVYQKMLDLLHNGTRVSVAFQIQRL